jgi:hypothetical protein
MKNINLFFVICLIIGTALFVGCGRGYFAKNSYFNGAVIVEYEQNTMHGTEDYLTFHFKEKGTYEISFSITPGGGSDQKNVPNNITKVIEATPHEFVIEQYILPSYLRIMITKDGKSESHDFS